MHSAGLMNTINIFLCCAHEDEGYRNELAKQLRILSRQGLVLSWHDGEISPGMEWAREIEMHLNMAHLILLLLSPDFMDSDFCYSIEMKRALERHETGEARVIPIILRAVYWKDAPFSKLQVLPVNTKPIKSWTDADEAFLDIVNGIQRVVKELQTLSKIDEGNIYYKSGQYQEAFASYEEAFHLDSSYSSAYKDRDRAFEHLRKMKEAQMRLEDRISEIQSKLETQMLESQRYEEQLSQLKQSNIQTENENQRLHMMLEERDKELRLLREKFNILIGGLETSTNSSTGSIKNWADADQIMLE